MQNLHKVLASETEKQYPVVEVGKMVGVFGGGYGSGSW